MSRDEIADRLQVEADAARSIMTQIAEYAEDEEIVSTAIEGETSLLEAVQAALDEIDHCEILITGCAAKIDQIKGRKDRALKRKDRIRAAILQAMATSGAKTLKLPTATLTETNVSWKPVITEEADLPPEVFVQPPPKVDPKKLKELLADGDVPGATRSNGGSTLTIRRT